MQVLVYQLDVSVYVKINKLFNRKGIGGQICAFSAFETSPHPSSHTRNFFEKSQSVLYC